MSLVAPFTYFGSKRDIASVVWRAFGEPTQYIEPFCGSCAVLLAAPRQAPLEIVNDCSGWIANFWRCVRHQPAAPTTTTSRHAVWDDARILR